MSNKGVYKWSAIDRVLNSAMTFAGNVVLARLLDPNDFGLVAMVAIFIAIAQNLSGCGMSDGLIHKHRPTERDYSTVFVFNAAFGIFFGVLFALIGRPLADFFGREQIADIMVVLGICFFFQTLSFTQETRMRKELDMRRMAIVRLSSTATATAFGIVMAATGWGYWALVMTHSGLCVFTFVYYLLISRWMPRIAFYKDSFRELFGYGFHLMLAFVVNQIGRNINTSVLGKYATPAASGIYSQAQKLEEVPFAITESVFNWPFFAVLSNEQQHSARQSLCSSMHVRLWTINLTIGLLLLLVSWPAFNLLYGAKWDAAIPIFRLLLIYGICTSMKYYYQVVFKAYGLTRLVRNLTFIEVAMQLILLAFFYDKGIVMIAMTQIIAVVAIAMLHAFYYCRVLEVRCMAVILEFMRSLAVPAMAFGLSAAIGSIWYMQASPFVNCVGLTLIYIFSALAACEFIRPPFYAPVRRFIINKLAFRK